MQLVQKFMNGRGAFPCRTKAERWTVQRTQTNLIPWLQGLALDQGLRVEKGPMAAAFVDHVKLAFLKNNRSMVARDESVRQHQVAVLQAPDGKRRVHNVDLFLPGIVNQQQNSGGNGFGHR